MVKKTVSILFALLLAAAFLANCGDKSQSPAEDPDSDKYKESAPAF